MEVEIGRGKKGRQAYGFDDIAIVPSRRTRDPDDVDITWTLGPYRFELPVLASAMDGVVSPESAVAIGKLGGLAALNLEGIWSRYEDASRAAGAHRGGAAVEMPPARCRRSTASPSSRSSSPGGSTKSRRRVWWRRGRSPPSASPSTTRSRWRPGSTSSSSRAPSSRRSTSRRSRSRSTSRSSSPRCRCRASSAVVPRTRRAFT